MNLEKIYRKAIDIALKNKPIWVIGVAVAVFSGGGFNLSQNFNIGDFNELKRDLDPQIFNQLSEYFKDLLGSVPTYLWVLFGLSFILALIVGFVFSLVVRNWAIGSLIGGINDAIDQKVVTLKSSSAHGIRGLKSLIWLNLVPWFLYFLTFLVVIFLIIILFVIFWPLRILAILVLGTLSVLAFLALAAIQIWATRVAVLEGKSGKESFFEGWQLVKEHLFKMIVLGCSNTCISCLSGCVLSCFVITIIVPLGLSGAFFYSLSHENPIITFGLLTIGLIFIIPLLLGIILFQGIYTVFNYSTWNILYREIRQKNSQGEQQ